METKSIDILLIEDNPDDARRIREMLIGRTREPIRLLCETTLQAGLRAATDTAFDVVILDLSLPDSQGLDTVMQARSELPDIPIVVLAGAGDEDTGMEAIQMGAQDYLPKDEADAKSLTRAIRYAIERHSTQTALRRSEEEYRSLIDDVFDTSMVAVIILDQDFRVVWCNEATEIYFGIRREVLMGRDKRVLIDKELKCIFADPDDYSQRLLQAYTDNTFTEHFECRVLPENEREERWLEHWSQPIRNGMYKGGRIEQYTDITDRKQLESAEQEQREFAEALHDIAALLTGTLDLSDVLERILDNLGRIVPHDTAAITMLDENDQVKIVQQRRGLQAMMRDTQEIELGQQLQMDFQRYIDQMRVSLRPLIVADLREDADLSFSAQTAKLHAYIGAPILLQDRLIGFVNLFSEAVDFFNETHAERLRAFAELAAIAIQNAQLYEQSQQLATLEERQRLARELHDSVSQTLFTCRALAESALRRWHKDPVRARELLDEVHQLTQTALAEMRVLLLELRPATLTNISLNQLFRQYLRSIQARRQFEWVLHLEDVPALPPNVQIALYRMMQEALNNIEKHAQPQVVEIRLGYKVGQLQLLICDDGKGFDVGQVRETSLGLGIMRERAARIGAELTIESATDEGTQIRIHWREDTDGGR